MDPIKERGFAVVLPRNNNLNTLYKAAQDQRDNQIRQQEQISKEFENIKLGMPAVRSELMGGAGQLFKETVSAMNNVQREAYQAGGLTSEHRTTINNLKQNWEMQKSLVEAYNKDFDAIASVTNAKPDLFNRAVLVDKTKALLGNAFVKDENGNVIGFNDMSKPPSELLNDPDVYDDAALGKEFIGQLGEMAIDTELDSFGSTNKQKFTTNLFQIDKGKDGKSVIKLDPNTGKPVPVATPESVLLWDSDPIRKGKLDKYAQSITKEGENWEKNRAQAFKKFVVEPFAKFEEDKTIKDASDAAIGRGEKLANIESRYKTLRNAVYNFDETSLAQANNVMNNVQVEFRGGGAKGNLPGEGIPDRIVIRKRELQEVPDPLLPGSTKKQTVWNEYELPIRNDEQKEKALFEINTVMDEAGDKSGLKIGNDAIRVVHDKYKAKNKPKKGAFDDL